MKFCESEGCSGLDPCEGCAQVRRAVLMRAVKDAGIGREEAEKFFRAYAEAFDMAIGEIRKIQEAAQETAQQKRLEEKEAREKASRKETKGVRPGTAKVSPVRRASRDAAPNGETKPGASHATGNHQEHQAKEEDPS